MYCFTSLIYRHRSETLEYVDLKIEFGLKRIVSVISSGTSMQGNARMSTAYSTVYIQNSTQRTAEFAADHANEFRYVYTHISVLDEHRKVLWVRL